MQKNVNFYERVVDRCKNGSDWEKIVGWALYLSFKTEQDAFLEQYYEYLQTYRHYTVDPMEDPQNPYCKFDDAFNAVDNTPLNNKKLKESFGITLHQLYHILNSAEERLFKKMSHIYQKWRNDISMADGSINPTTTTFMIEWIMRGISDVESDATY